jgi:hypothetical protein
MLSSSRTKTRYFYKQPRLRNPNKQFAGAIGCRGQVGTEYLILTAFMLTVVTIAFSYAYYTYSLSTTAAQASDALQSVVNGVNEVYALGEGNQLLIDIYLPNSCAPLSTTGFGIIHKCYTNLEKTGCPGGQTATQDPLGCGPSGWACVNSSAIQLNCGANNILLYPTSALVDSSGTLWPRTSGNFTLKVFWNTSHRINVQDIGQAT